VDKYYHQDVAFVDAELALKSVVRALTFRWRLILAIAAIPALLTVLSCWTIQPKFSATARILIDPRPRQIMENEIAKTGMGTSSFGGDVLMLDSQARILDSRELLTRVVSSLSLDHKLEASGPIKSSLRQALHWLERGPQAAGLPEHSNMDEALQRLRSNLRIDRVGNTYVFDVTFTSPDRNEAADVANAVITTYIQTENENYRSRVQENIDALTKLVSTLRAESDSANQQLVAFRAQTDNLEGSTGQAGSGALLREILQNDIQTQVELSRQNLRIVSERAMQAKVEQEFPSDTVRIVSRAEASTYTSGPRPLILMLASALLGMMAGTVVAWISHLFNATPESKSVEAQPKTKSTGRNLTRDQILTEVFAS
jgi:uncharacterized protein involved in exopolysaccharide biosynthesis